MKIMRPDQTSCNISRFKIVLMIIIILTIIPTGIIMYALIPTQVVKIKIPHELKVNIPGIDMLCSHTECIGIDYYNRQYRLDNAGVSLIHSDILILDSVGYIKKFMVAKTYVDNNHVVVYTLDGMMYREVIDVSILTGVVVILLSLVASIAYYRYRDKQQSTNKATERSSLEHDMKTLIAATAYHEMMTPITVIRSSAETLCNNANNNLDRDTLDMLLTTIDRLESVLRQLSANRNVSKSKDISVLYITKSVLDSLGVIVTESNFTYEISNMKVLEDIRSYKLDNGSLGNILNNMFKNSLEAGATVIRVFPRISDDILHMMILDNGSGIPLSETDNNDTIFNLGVSSKRGNKNLLSAHISLSENTHECGNGLYLVRVVLESAGGSIQLIKTSSSGTTFMLSIPVKKCTEVDGEN